MRKLYIPTSTFNFNNILSSESISPKAFYGQRGFGYPRWMEIPENGNLNSIILYERPFEFARPKSETEDHPMLIAIETDEDFKLVADGVYYCDHTIYLYPRTTQFIFFSEQDKRVTLSLSDSSLETKLIRIYEKQLVIQKCPQNTNGVPSDCNVPLNSEAIAHDYRLNKMKGLLYGYYIGAMLSTSASLTNKHNVLSGLQDIFSAILSSENSTPTVAQEDRIKILLNRLQQNFPEYQICLKYTTETETDKLINELKGIGTIFPNCGMDKEQILNMLLSKKDNIKENRAMIWLREKQDELKRQIQKERSLLMPEDKEIVTEELSLKDISCTAISDEKEKLIIRNWANEVILNNCYDGNISSCKEKLSDEITLKAKELYNELWDGSQMKMMLNEMRRYVRGQENNMPWDNYLIASIASVLAKGNDWEQLLSFMKAKSMSDYRLAFAFYGELHGFANLTRDFTDNIFNLDDKTYDDKTYIEYVYKEIDNQLLGCKYHVENSANTPSCSMDNLDEDNKDDVVNGKEMELYKFQETIKRAASEAIKTNKYKLEKSLDEALIQNGDNQNYQSFLELLATFDGWKPTTKGPSKPWQRLRKQLIPDDSEIIGKKNSNTPKVLKHTIEQKGLFDAEYNSTATNDISEHNDLKYFYNDNEAWSIIEDLVPSDSKKDMKKDLDWFQEKMREPRQERSKYYQSIDETNNSLVIDKFCHLKEQLKDGKEQAPYFTKELRERIRERLISYYVRQDNDNNRQR